MSRLARSVVVFAMFVTLVAGSAVAQGQRSLMERKVWYVTSEGRVNEMSYWRVYMGDYDVKLSRRILGKGQLNLDVRMNYQLLSSGYIEGAGAGSEGRQSSLPSMRIRVDGRIETIRFDDIDYIFDYGTKVVMKDGRRGDFLIGEEQDQNLEVRRFQLSEYRQVKITNTESELREVQDRVAIIGIGLTREAAQKAAREPVTD